MTPTEQPVIADSELPDCVLNYIAECGKALLTLGHYWSRLLVDTRSDEFSVGGQSLSELRRLNEFEEFLFRCQSLEIPAFHDFADGVYMRSIQVPKDAVILGHEHRHSCLNIMSAGRVLTIVNGEVQEFVAPFRVLSGAHTRKLSIVVEPMVWTTIHSNPDNETDIAKLEERLFIKSATYLKHNT